MNYKQYLIGKDTKVKDAMKKIDSVKPKILFVVENEKLIGALTDGDVRRYLLAGGKVTDDADKACNKKLKRIAHSKEEAIEMLDKNYIAIPVINKDGVLLDVYVGNNKEDKTLKKINIPVVINAGGKGTRLDPFTKVLPKPSLPPVITITFFFFFSPISVKFSQFPFLLFFQIYKLIYHE